MSVTEELKDELGGGFIEVRRKSGKETRVVLHEKEVDMELQDAFWPWVPDRKVNYTTTTIHLHAQLKQILLEQKPVDVHANRKHRIYPVNGEVKKILQIHETRNGKRNAFLDEIFSKYEKARGELEQVEKRLDRPLYISAMSLPATKLHATGERFATDLCRMIVVEEWNDSVPEVYECLLNNNREFQKIHGKLKEKIKEKANRLREAIGLLEKHKNRRGLK